MAGNTPNPSEKLDVVEVIKRLNIPDDDMDPLIYEIQPAQEEHKE